MCVFLKDTLAADFVAVFKSIMSFIGSKQWPNHYSLSLYVHLPFPQFNLSASCIYAMKAFSVSDRKKYASRLKTKSCVNINVTFSLHFDIIAVLSYWLDASKELRSTLYLIQEQPFIPCFLVLSAEVQLNTLLDIRVFNWLNCLK